MQSYPSSMSVSTRALTMLGDLLRQRRSAIGTRWRRLTVGQHTHLVLAHLREGETYTDLAYGFAVGHLTVYRYLRETLDLLAALAPTLDQAMAVAAGKAFVILDGTLLHIDRVRMSGGRDRPFYSGKHKVHGLNVQVIADPAGRLIWASPCLPGAQHDMVAAREHGVIDALNTAGAGGGRHRLSGRWACSPGPATSPPSRPRHRPLPTPVQRAEAGQHRPRPHARTR
jgi:hypothetical protein